jgi:hypothetical protein
LRPKSAPFGPSGSPQCLPGGDDFDISRCSFFPKFGSPDDPFWQNSGPPRVCNYVTLRVGFFGPILGLKKHPISGPKSGPKIEPKNDPNFVSKCSPKNRPIFWDPLAPSRASKTKPKRNQKRNSMTNPKRNLNTRNPANHEPR